MEARPDDSLDGKRDDGSALDDGGPLTDRVGDAAVDGAPEAALPDTSQENDAPSVVDGATPDAVEEAAVSDSSSGDIDGATIDTNGDRNDAACVCDGNPSLECFYDASGPFWGPRSRPSTDVGLAQQICDRVFEPGHCVDNVEVFEYGACNRRIVQVTGCFATTAYVFDTTTHALVGTRYGGDTGFQCRGGGTVTTQIYAGDAQPTCERTSCVLQCRLIGGWQTPTCSPSDAGGDTSDSNQDTSDGSQG